MFVSPYGRITPVTADYTAVKDDDMLLIPAAENAINTITLQNPDVKDDVYVQNLSLFPQRVVAPSGATLYGVSLVMPGQLVHYQSLDSAWYSFGAENAASAVASVALSSAQFLALNSTPVTLIPAPGTGRVIMPSDIHMQMTRTATAYANGGALEFRWGSGGAKVTADIAAALVTTGGAGVAYAAVGGIEASITPVPNAALVLIANGADFITGTGTAKLKIAYRIDDFN